MAQSTVTTPDILGVSLTGDTGPQFGHAMAVGDFDGDGVQEVAVSTFESMETGFGDNEGRGHVYVYKYDSVWSSVPIEVPHPDGTPGVCVFFGWALAAGDVDDDGKDELVVSEPGGDGAGANNAGAVFIFDYDDSTDPTFILKHKFRSHPDHGGQLGDNFGWSIALGDINGDEDLDLIVGARYWSQCEEDEDCIYAPGWTVLEDWTGSVFVYDNSTFASPSTWVEVTGADLTIRGEESWSPENQSIRQTRGYFGARVAVIGDLNDDGCDEFIVAATRRTPDDFDCTSGQNFSWWDGQGWVPESLEDDCRVGKVYLLAGATTYPSAVVEAGSYAKMQFWGEDEEDMFGQALASQGDLNGDGINDIVVASLNHTETNEPNVGRVYVFLMPDYSGGWPTGSDKIWEAKDANIKIDGPTNDAYVLFGYAMACNGNTNKQTDSRADLMIGAPRANNCTYQPLALRNDRGFAYLFRYTGSMSVGPNGGHETWAASAAVASYHIDCHDNYRKQNPWFGRSIAFIGDLEDESPYNDEILIGCPGWDTTTYPFTPPDLPDDRGGVYMITH